ncbi:MAG: class I SAM-dependent methyltransferase [Ignavibacteria bacterium]|jgi:ubiquinone/menaquinone biosynthesis C-methylase UbiE|nr:class I SAM-dependent methyltransferase [Ignavibacteria bacterium]MCU7504860.1 class I SAM-dependent methyltransferase [Ignavibacteria bacterium]MCU7518328.1 class I SAM-dependent methyltransferase [Ignavibacteria bacterium]
MTRQTNETFFDSISSFYDDMIGFKAALERRKAVLNKFLPDSVKTAADLGCGSGLDSLSLALKGLKVTAFDQSEGMLRKAGENASEAALDVQFVKSTIDRIPKRFSGRFDVTFSLGNTLANLPPERLSVAVKKISELLNSRGTAVIQILNYSRILKEDNRIINITEMNGEVFIRFYDFMPESLNFNILKFKKDKPSERELFTTKLYPHRKDEFLRLLKDNGLRKVKFYGGLALQKFEKYNSQDLVVVASK